jgi:hypothetical protein
MVQTRHELGLEFDAAPPTALHSCPGRLEHFRGGGSASFRPLETIGRLGIMRNTAQAGTDQCLARRQTETVPANSDHDRSQPSDDEAARRFDVAQRISLLRCRTPWPKNQIKLLIGEVRIMSVHDMELRFSLLR